MMNKFNLDVTGEFLVMAATLIYMKSRSLLPEPSAEEEVEEFKEELTARLLEYKKFKEIQGHYREKEKIGQNIFTREKKRFEGELEIDLTTGEVFNKTKKEKFKIKPFSKSQLEIYKRGGLLNKS